MVADSKPIRVEFICQSSITRPGYFNWYNMPAPTTRCDPLKPPSSNAFRFSVIRICKLTAIAFCLWNVDAPTPVPNSASRIELRNRGHHTDRRNPLASHSIGLLQLRTETIDRRLLPGGAIANRAPGAPTAIISTDTLTVRWVLLERQLSIKGPDQFVPPRQLQCRSRYRFCARATALLPVATDAVPRQ